MKTDRVLKNTIFILILIVVSLPTLLHAQGSADALRYSYITPSGTARFVSMGGAFGALGADFSAIGYNPAGLGVYRSSEFTITPSFKNRSIETDYNGSTSNGSRTRFGFDNIGFVTSFSNQKSDEKGLVMVNLGIGYNQLIDFNGENISGGENTSNSIMDYFAGRANGYNYSDLYYTDDYDPFTSTNIPWEAIMAWNTYLVDTVSGETSAYFAVLNPGDGVNQQQTVSTKGSLGEFVISLASNFSNKFYLGASIGIQNVLYEQVSLFSENAFPTNGSFPNGDRFSSLDYKETLNVSGAGFNFKVGAIYRPIPLLRLGVALHTPTYFSLNETYRSYLSSEMLLGSSGITSPRNRFDYGIESPYRMIGSLAFTFEEKGLLSVDVEYLDYTTMRLNEGADGTLFTSENSYIKSNFKNAVNLRAGGEFWLGDIALRAGYAMYGNPYVSTNVNSNAGISVISGGLGYRLGGLFMDVAYQRMVGESNHYYYNLVDVDGSPALPPVLSSMVQGKVLLTVGFKF